MVRLTRWNDRTEMAELEDWDTEEEWKDFMGSLDVPEQIGLGTAIDKLAEYEDAEEQNLLVQLPCKVGDKVWIVFSDSHIEERRVVCIKLGEHKDTIFFDDDGCYSVWDKDYSDFYKCIFFTREEAEQALIERGSE